MGERRRMMDDTGCVFGDWPDGVPLRREEALLW